MKDLSGVVAAPITPMLPNGVIDEDSTASLVRHLIKSGANGLYPCGTTGESLLLSAGERQRIVEVTARESSGQIPLYVQCGAMTPDETAEHIKHAQKIGVDGIGLMTPVFFGFDQRALEAYYDEMILLAGELPVYIYNIPAFTHNDLLPGTFHSLVGKHKNLVGIKFSHPNDIRRVQDYLYTSPRPASLLIGSDRLLLQALAAGAAGTITGTAAVLPKRFTSLWSAFVSGDLKAAAQIHKGIVEVYKRMDSIPQIPAFKAMLRMMGVIKHDTCRKPFLPLLSDELKSLERILKDEVRQ